MSFFVDHTGKPTDDLQINIKFIKHVALCQIPIFQATASVVFVDAASRPLSEPPRPIDSTLTVRTTVHIRFGQLI